MSAPQRNMPYVRLGSSGFKVSKIILGCMSYGSPEWQEWVLGEDEAFEHIKTAYDAGINTFDTANVYSNGLSEEILGRAIKKYELPRDEIVVMTKVFMPWHWFSCLYSYNAQVFFRVSRTMGDRTQGGNPDEGGYVNQHGLSRKVQIYPMCPVSFGL
jgi:aryl-alcohol dehydrogenase-like predicted oxidoreductase